MNTSHTTDIVTTDASLTAALRTASRLLRAERDEALQAAHLDRRSLRVLRRIAGPAAGSHHRLHGAHRGHGRGPRVAGSLLRRGYAVRTDEGLAITESGTQALARVDAAFAALDERLTSALTPEQSTALHGALDVITAELGGTPRLERLRAERHRLRLAFREGFRAGRHSSRAGHHGSDRRGEHRGGCSAERGHDHAPRAQRCSDDAHPRAGHGAHRGHRSA